MSEKTLCDWFQIPSEAWPPNHYQLLGVRVGESDIDLIERRAQKRMEAVRQVQMKHPESATEALNCIAKALICLSQPHLKADYDRQLEERKTDKDGKRKETALDLSSEDDTQVETKKPSPSPVPPMSEEDQPPPLPEDWVKEHSNPELEIAKLKVQQAEEQTQEGPTQEVPTPVEEVDVATKDKVDPLLEDAKSPSAWKGLGLCWALRKRIKEVHALQKRWEKLGLLRKLVKIVDKKNARVLEKSIQGLLADLEEFPSILGKPGKPGFLVVSLEHCEMAPTLEELDDGQRTALVDDWERGKALLAIYENLLQTELESRKGQSLAERIRRVISYAVTFQPGFVFLLFVLLLLNAAIWTWYFWG